MDAADRRTSQARGLARVLVMGDDENRCEACLDGLEEYVEAQLAGEDYARRFATLAAHLDSCVECAEAYAMLYEVRLAEAEGRLPSPAAMPPPDLSFLPSSSGPRTLLEALDGVVSRAGTRLRITLSKALLELLPRPSGPALAFRGGEEPPRHQLDLERPAAHVAQIQLAIYDRQADSVSVQVKVALEGREWPDLGEIPVALSAGAAGRLAMTDAWGVAVFDDVPVTSLDGLQVDVELGPEA
jgi:hypothetical protein